MAYAPTLRRSSRFALLQAIVLGCITALLISGCASNRAATVDSNPLDAGQPRDTSLTRMDSASRDNGAQGQFDAPLSVTTGGMLPNGVTLGERLGQLDADMKTAPADSLPAIKAEYKRLLALRERMQATNELPPDESGLGATPSPADTGGTIHTKPMLGAIPSQSAQSPAVAPAKPPAAVSPGSTYPAASAPIADNVDYHQFKGLRKSEIRYAERANSNSGMAAQSRTLVASQPRTVAYARGESNRANATSDIWGSKAVQRNTVDGQTALQAGNYQEAASKLGKVAASGGGTTTRYQYAQSLEKSGRSGQASREYLTAASGNGAVSDRAYLEHCRLVAQQGNRQQARQLVLDFIRQHPDSSQIVRARQLLQTI